MSWLSIIVPTLNEAQIIVPALTRLESLRERGVEIIVADGGSSDGTPALAAPLADQVLTAPPGRAHQMNAGPAWRCCFCMPTRTCPRMPCAPSIAR